MPFSIKLLYPYFETLLITLLFIALGLYFYPQDPLLLDTAIPFSIILLLVISLFYGLRKGLLALALLGIVFYFYYHDNFVIPFLSHLLITLIAGQFYHFWFKRYDKAKAESTFLKEKVQELSNAFYTLKISHDTLEKSYALQPHSLRYSINQLQELFFKEGSHNENFLHLIAKAFHVQGSLLAFTSANHFHTVSSIEEGKKLYLEDPLVQKALQTQEMSYIHGEAQEGTSRYLAVIPLQNKEDKTDAILAIDKMPFMAFNQNNLISISILFAYFLDQVKLWSYLQDKGHTHITKEALFAYHYNSMRTLSKQHKTACSVLIFKPQDALMSKKLIASLDKTLRGLDRYKHITEFSTDAIMILLPFTNTVAMETISNKILSSAHIKDGEIPHMGFDITQEALLTQYLKEK